MSRAITSPSNFFRRVLCPGSELAELHSPKQNESKAAARGTLLHWADANDVDLVDISDRELKEKNQKLREDWILGQMGRLGIPLDTERVVVKEIRYTLKDLFGNPVIGIDGKPFTGQPDHLEWLPKFRVLFVLDSKFGRKAVENALTNWQVKIYAVMCADPDFGDFEAALVLAAITQPLVEEKLHGVQFDESALRKAKTDILNAIVEYRSKKDVFNPSIDACFFCDAAGGCPPAIAMVRKIQTEKIWGLTPPELEALWPVVKMAEAICVQYYKRMEIIAEKMPHLLKGFKLEQGNSVRVIKPENNLKAIQALDENQLMTGPQFAECCKVSISALEENLALKFNLGGSQARKEIDSALADVIEIRRNKPTLVKIKPVKEITE